MAHAACITHILEQVYGDFCMLTRDDPHVFAYTRTLEMTTALVLLNFSKDELHFTLPEASIDKSSSRLLLGNMMRAAEPGIDRITAEVRLEPYEGRVYFQG